MTLRVRLCKMSIKRHYILWQLTGGGAIAWKLHRDMIVAVYGYSTYVEAWTAFVLEDRYR